MKKGRARGFESHARAASATLLGGALLAGVAGRGLLARAEGIVEHVESLVEPRGPSDGIGPDEGGGGVATGLHERGEGGHVAVEGRRVVVADLVLVGIAAGEDGRVRGTRLGHLDHRVEDERALACEPVQGRRLRRGEAVGPDPVGAQGVDGDEQEVRRGRGRGQEEGEDHSRIIPWNR